MIRIFTLIAIVTFPFKIIGQIITTDPSLPIDSKSVIVTFDATQGNGALKGFTGDVYAHTGVITDKSTSSSDWKYVKTTWGTNTAETKLTRISANIYQLFIVPNIRAYYGVPVEDIILKLAFVFRSADTNLQGKTATGGDIFADVFAEGLHVSISTPSLTFTIFDNEQDFELQANALANDSISLFVDNLWITSVKSQTLTTSLHASGTTKHTIIVKAYKSLNFTSDTAYYLIHGPVSAATLPTGTKDGINYIDNNTATIVLYAPYKSYVYLIGDFNNWQPDNNYLMKKDGGRYWITVNNLTTGKEYIFQYLIDGSLHIADPYTDKTSDPNDHFIPSYIYPGMLTYPSFKTSEIASVLQTGQTPYKWKVTNFTPPSKEKLIIYELLIRDFTSVRDIKTITDTISYLKRLGVNAIELMPFNEFEGNDSWGYNPSFYFAPDKAYGTKNDYKTFIDTCHKNGIAVIQDMVLNHSYGESPLVRMYFANGNPTAQNPWYNQVSNMLNPSLQFGYDFNHDSPNTRKLVDSINSYWMSEYKIDGFRYDFTKGFSNTPYGVTDWAGAYDASRVANLERMSTEIWKRKSNAIIIFEHLADNSEETVLANFGVLLWGNLNYAFNQATMGYNTGSDFLWISYKNRGWNNPNIMAYMESHDEERLMFKNLSFGNSSGSYSVKDLSTALKRMQMATAFFYSVPGPKMLWQFGELGYDISIDFGGRLGQKPVHWDYYNDWQRQSLYNVTKAMINLKQNDPTFSTTNFTLDVAGSVKHIELLGQDEQIELVGNIDVLSHSGAITFPASGKWYELFKGDSITLSSTTYNYILEAGDYKLFGNKKLPGFSTLHTDFHSVFDNTEFSVYPNPCTYVITLTTVKPIKSVLLRNITGDIIIEKQGTAISSLDVKELKTGVYLLFAEFSDGSLQNVKVVKE